MDGKRRPAGLLVALTLGLLVFSALGGAVAARGIDQPSSRDPQDCDPCPLSRVVVDQPAWDETVTVTDRAAWDETVTVVDTPSSTAYRTVVDSSARSVAHHDLVRAAYTVARQVLVTPAHDESYQLWVTSGYWTQHWIDTSHYETRATFVTSGYWSSYWVDTSHYEYRSYYVSQGYWNTYWVDTGGYYSCYGGGEDRECDYIGSGYWSSYWVDTSYWAGQWVWISSGYSQSYWVNTSHWEYPQVWVSSGYYQQQWISTGGYWGTGYTPYVCSGSGIDRECDGGDPYTYWVATGYYTTNFWVDTSHYETRTRHVDDVFTTVYDTVPALYRDWIETIAEVTHQEAYTIPAVTHTATVHHDAVTHTEVVHHPAVTHEEPITFDQLTTQNRQSAEAASSGTTAGTDGTATPPSTTIPVVSTITVVDRPARALTRTVVDRAAYDESRTVVDAEAWDETVSTPVYGWVDHCWGGPDGDCGSRYEISDYAPSTVHHDAVTHTEIVRHDAVTHTEVVTLPAVTHTESASFSLRAPDTQGNGGTDRLLEFGALMGLVALSGAGRYLSRRDLVVDALRDWSQTGRALPGEVAQAVEDGSVSSDDATHVMTLAFNEVRSARQGGFSITAFKLPNDSPPTPLDPPAPKPEPKFDKWSIFGGQPKPDTTGLTAPSAGVPTVVTSPFGYGFVIGVSGHSPSDVVPTGGTIIKDPAPPKDLTGGILGDPAPETDPTGGILADPAPPKDPTGGILADPAPVWDPTYGIDFALSDDGSTESGDGNVLTPGEVAMPTEAPEGDGSQPKVGDRVGRLWGRGEDPLPEGDEPNKGAAPDGHSWTPINGDPPDDLRGTLGIPDRNPGRMWEEGTLVDVTGVETRVALEADGNPGGGAEYLIPDPGTQVDVDFVGGVNDGNELVE